MPLNIQRSILGTLLLRPELYFGVSDKLRSFMFAEGFSQIAEWMFARLGEGEKVNLHHLADALPAYSEEILQLHTFTDSARFG